MESFNELNFYKHKYVKETHLIEEEYDPDAYSQM